MKKFVIVIAVIILGIFIAGLCVIKPALPPRSTFKLTGRDGLPFKATIKADGGEVAFSGKLPAEVEVVGHSVEVWFQKMEASGTIKLGVSCSGGSGGSVSTSEVSGGVRAQVYQKLFVSKFMVTTFRPHSGSGNP
jgi:hypothetical protein